MGSRQFSDYLYTKKDILWGRGIRGPLLRQLWRTYCPTSDSREKVRFKPETDCAKCSEANNCPFNNLRGAGDGEFKDTPKLIITNLNFRGKVEPEAVVLVTKNDQYLGVVPEKGPVHIGYIPLGAEFEFEILLMGNGVDFADDVVAAVGVSLRFLGWGGFCNEGFGRGEIAQVKKHSFSEFENKYVSPIAEKLGTVERATFEIVPVLLLERDIGGFYASILENDFKKKFIHSLNERCWQFYKENISVDIKEVSGRARTVGIRGWSRKEGRKKFFKGIGNELTLHFKELGEKERKALALARYGIGKYKNQGFGSLRLKEE